jgi:hypothetical protein
VDGSAYTLAYTATVPPDPAPNGGFGGVAYSLRLEGNVIKPGVLACAPNACTEGDIADDTAPLSNRIFASQLTARGVPADSSFNNSGGYFDFVTTVASGGTVQVVLPLTSGLPADAVYRKVKPIVAGTTQTNAVWSTFVTDTNNFISSAPGPAPCPAPGSGAYVTPVTGHSCLQLTIVDGGPNDADGAANGTVVDPGGVATCYYCGAYSGGSYGGCSLSITPVSPLERGDWWLLLGFVAWLGYAIRRKRAG